MNQLVQYFASAFVMLVLDALYLGMIKGRFAQMVVSIQRVVMKVKMIPAALCYLLMVVGLNHFILNENKEIWEAFLFGFVLYGVFDMTNMAIFKKYRWDLAIIDSVWGGILMSLTTAIVYGLRSWKI